MVYALPPDGPTYRWECIDSLEAEYLGDTNEGIGALQLTKLQAKTHTELAGHETVVWKVLTGYLPMNERETK